MLWGKQGVSNLSALGFSPGLQGWTRSWDPHRTVDWAGVWEGGGQGEHEFSVKASDVAPAAGADGVTGSGRGRGPEPP